MRRNAGLARTVTRQGVDPTRSGVAAVTNNPGQWAAAASVKDSPACSATVDAVVRKTVPGPVIESVAGDLSLRPAGITSREAGGRQRRPVCDITEPPPARAMTGH